MISLASILNPSPPPGPLPGSRFFTPPGSSSPGLSFAEDSPLPLVRHSTFEKHRMAKETSGFSKSKAKGVVNFPPFEDLDDDSLREVERFRVCPLGNIQDNCRHVPYNSSKKDFYEKTGRESFEVFQYSFKLELDDTEYSVMWDYNVGLVRMTPFFKCCNYPKTTPAKMLNLNPGLRDITHSITGGSIMAQGYWMPYSCAKAVCATFCHHIAGALIPIFGPHFPAECVLPEAPDHGRMSIDPAIVAEATREAEKFRHIYEEDREQQSLSASLSSPRPPQQRRNINQPHSRMHHSSPDYRSRQRVKGGKMLDSPYGTDTDEYFSGPEVGGGGNVDPALDFGRSRYPYTPAPSFRAMQSAGLPVSSSGWTPANIHQLQHQPHHDHARLPPVLLDEHQSRSQAAYHHANPWLSAIPGIGHYPRHHQPASSQQQQQRHQLPSAPMRSSASQALIPMATGRGPTSTPMPTPSPKRLRLSAENTHVDTDHEYDGGESHVGDSSPATSRGGGHPSDVPCRDWMMDEEYYKLHGWNNNKSPQQQHELSRVPPPGAGVAMFTTDAEKNAAMMLMKLCVRDADADADTGNEGEVDTDEHKSMDKEKKKRRRGWVTAGGGLEDIKGVGAWLQAEELPKKRRRATSM